MLTRIKTLTVQKVKWDCIKQNIYVLGNMVDFISEQTKLKKNDLLYTNSYFLQVFERLTVSGDLTGDLAVDRVRPVAPQVHGIPVQSP